jgi:hypothetical protein
VDQRQLRACQVCTTAGATHESGTTPVQPSPTSTSQK